MYSQGLTQVMESLTLIERKFSTMATVLKVEELEKRCGNFKLNNINFSLQEGKITGFIGINGAGKTTTIKSILGLKIKDSGTIKLFDKDLDKDEREFKNHIGVVLDDGYFYDNVTMKELKNIIAPAYSKWDENIFKNYINRFNLNVNQKISTLSKGMKMKYAIALALSHHADLLIMDEPTSGLDPLIRSELLDILLEFVKEKNKSVLFSTHITSDLERVADTLILIDKGKIIFNEDKNLLLQSHSLVKCPKDTPNEDIKELFLSLHMTRDGFEGITNKTNVLLEKISNVIIQKPTIEEIMLAYIGGNNDAI